MTELDDAIEEAMLYSDLALSELSAESIRALISAARRAQELDGKIFTYEGCRFVADKDGTLTKIATTVFVHSQGE